MKICPKCNLRPSLREIKKDFSPYCAECSSDYYRVRHQGRMEVINKVKDRPCMDCGIKYPSYVMDLDHREDKFKNVSQMRSYSMVRLLKEIDKCDVVCANCHRERTHQRSVAL